MSKDRQFIIVEARPESLRLNFVVQSGDQTVECVDAIEIAPNDPNSETSSLLDQLALDAAADAVQERLDWRGAEMIVIVGGADVACHYFEMPNLEGRALNEAVQLKLSQQLHFPMSDAVVEIRPSLESATKGETISVRAAAARQEVADAAVAFAQQTNRHLLNVTSSAVALTRLSECARSGDGAGVTATLHIDRAYSTLIIVGDAGPCLTTELQVGINDFTKALMRPIIAGDDVHQLQEEQALALRDRVGIPAPDADIGIQDLKGKSLLPLLEPPLQRFAQQLTQWLTFSATTEGGGNVSQIELVGLGSALPGLAESLAGRLKINVDRTAWLAKHARCSSSNPTLNIESFGPACAAAKFMADLPALLPEDEKKRRRIARIRRSTTKAGPVIAAATLGIAFLFNQVGGHLGQAVGDVESEMQRVQSMVAANSQRQQDRATINALKARFDAFSRETPNWLGVFKELSQILPKEIRVTRISTRRSDSDFSIVLDGEVSRSRSGQSYDETVEIALTALERSPFASAVRLVNSSRNEAEGGKFGGTLSVEISLAYEAPAAKEEK